MASGIVAVGLFLVVAHTAGAQCANAWLPGPGSPPNGDVLCTVVTPNGDLVVGGSFTSIGGIPATGIARWNGSAWSAFAPTAPGGMQALAALPNGDIVAIGSFIFGGSFQNVARWNGTSWQPLIQYSPIQAVAVLPNGTLILAGPGAPGSVARWTGTTWAALGTGLQYWIPAWPVPIQATPTVNSMCVAANGDLLVGGQFSHAGGVPVNGFARWNGTAWSSVGGPFAQVSRILPLSNGQIVATGWDAAGTLVIARAIGGSLWVPLSPSLGPSTAIVHALEELPNGDIAVGGDFATAGGLATANLARWNGTGWATLGGGTDAPVYALRMFGSGLFTGGSFTTVGTSIALPRLAVLGSTCAASALVAGSTCAGATPLGVLRGTSLPWIGATFRSRVDGVLAGIAVEVLGVSSASLPLPSSANCLLLASPDVLLVRQPVAGVITTAVAIPLTSGLVGASFVQQVAPVAFDAFGNPDLISTNALQVTVGAF